MVDKGIRVQPLHDWGILVPARPETVFGEEFNWGHLSIQWTWTCTLYQYTILQIKVQCKTAPTCLNSGVKMYYRYRVGSSLAGLEASKVSPHLKIIVLKEFLIWSYQPWTYELSCPPYMLLLNLLNKIQHKINRTCKRGSGNHWHSQ